MARKTRTSSNPLTPMLWAKKFMKYALEANFFAKAGFIGEGKDALFKLHKDLSVKAGNKVRVPMTGPLTGTGGGDNFNSEDIMEAYEDFYMDVEVHERGNTTGIDGPMTVQYMIEDWPKAATERLAAWKGWIMELEQIAALCGLYNLSSDVESVNEHEPTSGRIAYGGETVAGVIGPDSAIADGTLIGGADGTALDDYLLSSQTITDYLMGPNFIDQVVTYFMAQEPRPQLLDIEGRKCLLLMMTTKQGLNLRQNAIYIARNSYAEVRGHKNPLLADSMGFWNCGEVSVLLKPYGRVPWRTGAGSDTPSETFELNDARTAAPANKEVQSGKTVGRAMLLAAQAGSIAYGKSKNSLLFNRFDGDLDKGTGRKPFKGVDWVTGISKTIFKDAAANDQEDFACMCLDTMQI